MKKVDCMRLVDFHVHVTPPEISANWKKYCEKETYFAVLSQSPQNKFAGAEDVITGLEKTGFNAAVIFGFGFNDPGLCRMVNDYVIEKVQKFPGKLTGFMALSPNDPEIEKEIDRCYNAGLRGVGEIFPEGQNFSIDNENETRALTWACFERGLPLIVHVNEPVGHLYPGKANTGLRQIERFVENSPGLNIILAHLGGGIMFYEAMPEIREKFSNVFYDTAASPFLYGPEIYSAALSLGLGDKILFGSDFPLLSIQRYFPSFENIPSGYREKILGGNAMKLLQSVDLI